MLPFGIWDSEIAGVPTRATNCPLPDFGLPTPNFELPTPNSELPTLAFQLPLPFSLSLPAMMFSAADGAKIDDDGDDQNHEVQIGDGAAIVDHPGIGEGGDGKEEETDEGQKQPVVGALQIVRKQKHQHQSDAGEDQREDDEKTGHGMYDALPAL